MKISFNKIYYTGKETEYIKDAIAKDQVSGDGYYTKLVTSIIRDRFNANTVFMTTSATHALEMAVMLIGINPGDEIIMPSFTFPSTANAALLQGAKIVFADINRDTLNIDPEDVKKKITGNTRAIIPVHYAGVACEMDKLMDIALNNNLYVIEDAAHAASSKYRGKYLGTWGHIGCYSFHGTKNYISGEGGALLINTEDRDLIERASIIRQKGTNRDKYLAGEVDKYSWVDSGSSYAPSDLLMALLYAQMQGIDYINDRRKVIHEYYTFRLMKYVDRGILKITSIPKECESNYHLFYVLFKNESIRDFIINRLKDRGILAATHFVPLHTSSMGQKLGYKIGQLPVTEEVGRCLLRLPMYTAMTEDEMKFVMDNLEEILKVI